MGGKTLRMGYMAQPAVFGEAIDAEGWLHTGEKGGEKRRDPETFKDTCIMDAIKWKNRFIKQDILH